MQSEQALAHLVGLFISEVLSPALADLEAETGQTIRAVVNVMDGGRVVRSVEIPSSSARPEEAARAEVRVIFSEPTSAEASSFRSQAIIEGLAADTGFSGLAIRGRIRVSGKPRTATVTGRSNRYNVWRWEHEFSV